MDTRSGPEKERTLVSSAYRTMFGVNGMFTMSLTSLLMHATAFSGEGGKKRAMVTVEYTRRILLVHSSYGAVSPIISRSELDRDLTVSVALNLPWRRSCLGHRPNQ